MQIYCLTHRFKPLKHNFKLKTHAGDVFRPEPSTQTPKPSRTYAQHIQPVVSIKKLKLQCQCQFQTVQADMSCPQAQTGEATPCRPRAYIAPSVLAGGRQPSICAYSRTAGRDG